MKALFQTIDQADNQILTWCLAQRKTPRWEQTNRWISHSGDGWLYIALGVLLAVFDGTHGQAFLACGLMAFALDIPIYVALKHTFKRDRPTEVLAHIPALIQPSDRFSLPSGHTAAAFLMAALIAYFYPVATLYAYSLACLIGMSRLLLGVHFPSDIVLGALLGSSVAIITINYISPLLTL